VRVRIAALTFGFGRIQSFSICLVDHPLWPFSITTHFFTSRPTFLNL
jgi:hypothetical protein